MSIALSVVESNTSLVLFISVTFFLFDAESGFLPKAGGGGDNGNGRLP